MRLFKNLLAGLVAIGLVACGGGGGSAGTQPGVTAPTSTAAAVEVLTSAASVASAGDQVVITAFVKSAANVSLAAQEVKFTASSGVITVDSSLSNASGAVTARLSAGANKAQRDITVTVTSGSASGQIVIPVTGTRLSIAGSPALRADRRPSSRFGPSIQLEMPFPVRSSKSHPRSETLSAPPKLPPTPRAAGLWCTPPTMRERTS